MVCIDPSSFACEFLPSFVTAMTCYPPGREAVILLSNGRGSVTASRLELFSSRMFKVVRGCSGCLADILPYWHVGTTSCVTCSSPVNRCVSHPQPGLDQRRDLSEGWETKPWARETAQEQSEVWQQYQRSETLTVKKFALPVANIDPPNFGRSASFLLTLGCLGHNCSWGQPTSCEGNLPRPLGQHRPTKLWHDVHGLGSR